MIGIRLAKRSTDALRAFGADTIASACCGTSGNADSSVVFTTIVCGGVRAMLWVRLRR